MTCAAAGLAFDAPARVGPPATLVIGMITAPGAGWFWRRRSPRQGAARVQVRSMIAWLRRTSAIGVSKVSGGPDVTGGPPGPGPGPGVPVGTQSAFIRTIIPKGSAGWID